MAKLVIDSIEILEPAQQARVAALHEAVTIANDLHITPEHDPVSGAFDLAVLANYMITGRETFPGPDGD